mgnify:CR=1 FL=1
MYFHCTRLASLVEPLAPMAASLLYILHLSLTTAGSFHGTITFREDFTRRSFKYQTTYRRFGRNKRPKHSEELKRKSNIKQIIKLAQFEQKTHLDSHTAEERKCCLIISWTKMFPKKKPIVIAAGLFKLCISGGSCQTYLKSTQRC